MFPKKISPLFLKYLPALCSGCLLTLCFPKPHLWGLAFFALIPLMVCVQKLTPKESFYSGFIAGLVHFSTLIYWIVPTLEHFGGLHPILAVFVLALLCAYLSLYPAIFALALKKTGFNPIVFPFLAACLWVGLEYIRTYALTGFSWGVLGYSQYSNLLLIQIADLSGVYGVSFLLVLTNALGATLWIAWKEDRIKACLLPVGYTLALVAAVLFYGHQRMRAIDSQIKLAPQAGIGVVQGNIEQDVKWSLAFKAQTIEKYHQLSYTLAPAHPDLIVWPETALPFYYGSDKPLSARVALGIQSLNTSFLIGSPAFETQNKKVLFFNRANMFNPEGDIIQSYDKHHLVPFGEYVPFGRYLTFLEKITAQAGDFSAGRSSFVPLEFNTHKTGVLICFEILFPSIASEFVKNGATFLTTLTNDAWFGYTSAPGQHFSIAVFRAVENRRSVVRAANTGISGFIDPTGKILQTTALFTDIAIFQDLPALATISFYTEHKDLFTWLAMVAFLVGFVVKRFNNND
ncbi:MAG: apolipoprotein N-acyltransferase [Pseudomonadota bacterium]